MTSGLCQICLGGLRSGEKARASRRNGKLGGRPRTAGHGSPSFYRYHGCRCTSCVLAMREYSKRLRTEARIAKATAKAA